MHSYVVNFDLPKPSPGSRLLVSLIYSSAFFLLRFSWSFLWPSPDEMRRGLAYAALDSGIVAVMFGLISAFGPMLGQIYRTDAGLADYTLQVDDDSMTGGFNSDKRFRWIHRKQSIRRGRVRCVFPIKGRFGKPDAIGISERSWLSARMSGFIYIPKSLPEFEQLKQLAESWRATEGIG